MQLRSIAAKMLVLSTLLSEAPVPPATGSTAISGATRILSLNGSVPVDSAGLARLLGDIRALGAGSTSGWPLTFTRR